MMVAGHHSLPCSSEDLAKMELVKAPAGTTATQGSSLASPCKPRWIVCLPHGIVWSILWQTGSNA